MNVFLQHRTHLIELKTCGRPSSFMVKAIPVEVILRHPGNKELRVIIADLNRNGFGCSLADPSSHS